MKIEIITGTLEIDIYGFEGVALNKDYTGTAFRLSGKMWETVLVLRDILLLNQKIMLITDKITGLINMTQ